MHTHDQRHSLTLRDVHGRAVPERTHDLSVQAEWEPGRTAAYQQRVSCIKTEPAGATTCISPGLFAAVDRQSRATVTKPTVAALTSGHRRSCRRVALAGFGGPDDYPARSKSPRALVPVRHVPDHRETHANIGERLANGARIAQPPAVLLAVGIEVLLACSVWCSRFFEASERRRRGSGCTYSRSGHGASRCATRA